jgi:cyclic pyranopterin phosphate synthase
MNKLTGVSRTAVPAASGPSTSLASSPTPLRLVDRFGRVHRSLRISVTDACNIRCQYCMPAEGAQFIDSQRLLSFDQLENFVRLAVRLGIRKVRLTGGEPLLRPQLHQLVAALSRINDLEQIALTTNGMLLERQVDALVQAGLRRINVSLDTLSEATFQRLARRQGLDRVLAGIDSTTRHACLQVRLNALILRDVNLDDVCDLVEFACARGMTMRFIEFMPLDSDRNWSASRMVSGAELRQQIAQRLGPLRLCPDQDASQPATDYEFLHRAGRVGFIDPVSQPFCSSCDRLRLTADGKIRNCLFGRDEWDVAEVLRRMPFDEARLEEALRVSTWAKHATHGIDAPDFQPPERAMYQIGG